ncbi:MAG: nucleotidyltransferase family protein [Nitrospinae bacterium]|nr:nucleotidyltransferase family protein [Nitrospinota bacterium]
MRNKDIVIKILRGLKKEIKKRFRVKEIELFGSIVREQQKETSDIDFLVDFEEDADLFDLVGLGLFLEKKLNQKVDVVSKRALREELRESVLREAVSV